MTIERFPPASSVSDNGPPYSKAVRANGFVFVAGQVGVDGDGNLVPGGIVSETHQTIENIRAVLASVDLDLTRVVKAMVWLKDAADYAAFNTVYKEFFGAALPARACVKSELMGQYRVEIEVIAAARP